MKNLKNVLAGLAVVFAFGTAFAVANPQIAEYIDQNGQRQLEVINFPHFIIQI